MPTYSKIPKKLKAGNTTASGGFVVFAGLMSAGKVFMKLQAITKAFPAHGYVSIDGTKFYYCRYGLLSDPDIYSKR